MASADRSAVRSREWVPEWVRAVETAVWVVGPQGRIRFCNAPAESLLGHDVSSVIGRPCCEVLNGDPFTCPQCASSPGFACAEAPLQFFEPSAGGSSARGVRVVTIPVYESADSSPCIVHCALPMESEHRILEYLSRLASRSRNSAGSGKPLTKREREILRLLARDESTWSIAAELHVSHATVRNHVQHILDKLGAHSTMEAVARHLLDQDSTH